jgi:hypothetical protein
LQRIEEALTSIEKALSTSDKNETLLSASAQIPCSQPSHPPSSIKSIRIPSESLEASDTEFIDLDWQDGTKDSGPHHDGIQSAQHHPSTNLYFDVDILRHVSVVVRLLKDYNVRTIVIFTAILIVVLTVLYYTCEMFYALHVDHWQDIV